MSYTLYHKVLYGIHRKMHPGLEQHFLQTQQAWVLALARFGPCRPYGGSFYASRTQGLRPGLIYVTVTRLSLGAFWNFYFKS